VELCLDLDEGGTTAPAELIADVVRRVRIPVFVLIRPRTGAFVYSDAEIEIMTRGIESAAAMGAAGIVSGALTRDRLIDVERTRTVLKSAGELPVTFHRAFDAVLEPLDALERLIDLGVSRVLTSGAADTALQGAGAIAALRERARERIGIVAGGGVRKHNVSEVIAHTGVSEVHGRLVDEPSMRALVAIAHGGIDRSG
jgi:copper homeostasis protein